MPHFARALLVVSSLWIVSISCATAQSNVPMRLDVSFAAGGPTDVAALGMQPASNSPAKLAVYLKAEIAKWTKVVKDGGIKVE